MKRFFLRSLLKRQEGATIVEFALVAPVFFLMMMAIVEFGLYMVTQVTIESAVAQAGRVASLGVANPSTTLQKTVEDTIRARVAGLPRADTVAISANLVSAGGAVEPDMCLDTSPPTNTATCSGQFIDVNNNNAYDGAGALTLGNSGDLIEITASYPWLVFFPILNQYFVANVTPPGGGAPTQQRGVVIITSSTIIKNEP